MDVRVKVRNGLAMALRARKVRKEGFKQYAGTPERMCRRIIENAYDGFFRVSSGHFTQFWVRDFAFSCEALVELGYEKRVRATLRHTMDAFARADRIGQVVTDRGEIADFPCYGPDALALFLYALSHTGNGELVEEQREFMQREIDRFVRIVMDETGLPKRRVRFSSIRDHVARDAGCYDMTMIAVVAQETERYGLLFPISSSQAARLLANGYWNGTYFFPDLRRQGIVTGEANVFPFWTGVVTNAGMREEALTAIAAAGLDDPFPLRYVSPHDSRLERRGMHWSNLLAKGYETDSIWAHLGLCYLRVLADHDEKRAREHLATYTRLLEKHRTFLEVYDTRGEPFRKHFYVTDEAMSWCAEYLALAKRFRML